VAAGGDAWHDAVRGPQVRASGDPEPRRLVKLARLGNTTIEWILTGRHWESGAEQQDRLLRGLPARRTAQHDWTRPAKILDDALRILSKRPRLTQLRRRKRRPLGDLGAGRPALARTGEAEGNPERRAEDPQGRPRLRSRPPDGAAYRLRPFELDAGRRRRDPLEIRPRLRRAAASRTRRREGPGRTRPGAAGRPTMAR
jgi:hypothetical protein